MLIGRPAPNCSDSLIPPPPHRIHRPLPLALGLPIAPPCWTAEANLGFWRKQVIQPALDRETHSHVQDQRAWIAREPANPRPYLHLAQLYRLDNRHDEALALLLHSVRLDPAFAEAHLTLAQIYIVREDYAAAWHHARAAAQAGDPAALNLLNRYAVPDPNRT